MADVRVPLYDRLPEIYRLKDAEQTPPYQLQHYLALVEAAFGEIHKNIEALYHDLFIETCDPWVIPYIGDLLGNSALKGDPQTLRMDTADTIAMRRRKGTLTALEMLAYDLTGWAVHGAELRDNLVWSQSLNHQRPDGDGFPPYSVAGNTPAVPRGGTLPLRDPALLALLDTPFDPFCHVPDLRQVDCGQLRYNLPDLALFLWRLQEYQVPISKPVWANEDYAYPDPDAAPPVSPASPKMLYAVCFHIHPLGKPVRLFNTRRFDPQQAQVLVSQADEMPGPIHPARLTSDSPAGNPEAYVCVECYDPADPDLKTLDIGPLGLQLHVPGGSFQEDTPDHTVWRFQGADLSDWAASLHVSLSKYEVAVDPLLGRVILPVETPDQVTALKNDLLVTYTYGAVGPVGSHPISREALADSFVAVNYHHDPNGLKNALMNLGTAAATQVIEIQDSMVHDLDLGAQAELRLNQPLVIRAASGQRPIIRLKQPLRFLPARVQAVDPQDQPAYDAFMDALDVRLEGLYLTRGEGWPADPSQPGYTEQQDALIQRAAVHSLEIIGCTLDPGGRKQADGTREPIRPSLRLENQYGFTEPEADCFNQIPEIILQKSVTGPLQIDSDYLLFLTDAIVDAGQGTDQRAEADRWDQFAVAAANLKHGEDLNWGPETQVDGVTFFGRVHVRRLSGQGGLWAQLLEIEDNQHGCVKNSRFSPQTKVSDLPSNYGCLSGADLVFSSEFFEEPDYGRLDSQTDVQIREHGPGDEAMGATNCLWEAHKWRNLKIRFREFMPVGVRPLLVAVT